MYSMHGRSSDHQAHLVSSPQHGHQFSAYKQVEGDGDKSTNVNGSIKWMSSKMRLMRKMMNSNCSSTSNPQQHDGEDNNTSSNNIVRVCAACNTTKTPLWRSGPLGPKSLCNACGIRQRKARRAMAATANGLVLDDDNNASSMRSHKVQHKEKKTGATQYKKKCNKLSTSTSHQHSNTTNLCFEEFFLSFNKNSHFRRVLPQEEEQAAILLMALSCGLLHS
ncbi:Zinc finger, GATA-type [Dillenia turbinata]|uniref:Zinc finger, GATA-type n=1 Tax=Dillenia turbinata TaxID=194707 RepID=A0AAN8UF49_9MAGN